MTARDRELLRRQIVACCVEAKGNGVTLDMLGHLCRTPEGRTPKKDIEAECDYLLEKGFIATVSKAISPEVQAWKITAAGRDYAAQEGFE